MASERNSTPFGDSPAIDAFGRLRISQPFSLSEHQHQYDKGTLLWNEKITGGATSTHLQNEAAIQLAVSSTNDEVIRQTKKYHRYIPGKSHLIYFTFVFGEYSSGVTKRAGYFDTNNGIYFEQTSTGGKWVIRTSTSGSVEETDASDEVWNVDTSTGIDFSKAQIGVIDVEWLGVGRVRVGFVIDGKISYVHEFKHANLTDKVYTKTANLPVRYEIKRVSGSGLATMKQICYSVISEGGYEKRGLTFSASNGISGKTLSSRRPIVSIRPKTTFGTGSGVNRVGIDIDTYGVFAENESVYYEVVYNGTLSGASFSGVSDYSSIEYDTSATGIVSGVIVDVGYVAASAQNAHKSIPGQENQSALSKLTLSLDIDGANPTPLTIVATNLGNSPVAYGAIRWSEYQD